MDPFLFTTIWSVPCCINENDLFPWQRQEIWRLTWQITYRQQSTEEVQTRVRFLGEHGVHLRREQVLGVVVGVAHFHSMVENWAGHYSCWLGEKLGPTGAKLSQPHSYVASLSHPGRCSCLPGCIAQQLCHLQLHCTAAIRIPVHVAFPFVHWTFYLFN